MKSIRLALLLACLGAATPVFAQEGPTCDEGSIRATVQTELADCIAEARRGGGVDISIDVTCGCPESGDSGFVSGSYRCRPGEPCPFIVFLIGDVQLDCQGNVVSATCYGPPPES